MHKVIQFWGNPWKRYCPKHQIWYLPWMVDGKQTDQGRYVCAAQRVSQSAREAQSATEKLGHTLSALKGNDDG